MISQKNFIKEYNKSKNVHYREISVKDFSKILGIGSSF